MYVHIDGAAKKATRLKVAYTKFTGNLVAIFAGTMAATVTIFAGAI